MEMKTKKVKGSKWSNLPLDLLFLLGEEYLVLYPDKVRFSCVCVSWRCSIQPKLAFQHPRLPWLLDCFDEKTGRGRLFNLLNTKVVYHVQVPEAAGKIIRGSSHGWVVTVGKTPDIDLFNPLTGARIQLPPRYTFPDVLNYDPKTRMYELPYSKSITLELYRNLPYMTRVLLSSNPSHSHDFVAVAIYGGRRLAYCRRQDHKWTDLTPQPQHKKIQLQFADAIFCKGCLYALEFHGKMLVFEFVPGAKLVKTMHINHYPCPGRPYLVPSSSGDLLLVKQNYPPKKLEIFKLDTNKTRSHRWRQVKDLGDDILFLGYNSSSLAISYPEYKDKTNRIYFAYFRHEMSVCVFNVNNETTQRLLSYPCKSSYPYKSYDRFGLLNLLPM